MPSDDRIRIALEATAPARDRFRSVVKTTLATAREILAAGAGAERASHELGPFAAGRIDPERFAELSAGRALDGKARGVIAYAIDVLEEIAESDDSVFVVHPRVNETVGSRIADALTFFGRAFTAAHAIDQARHGRSARGSMSVAYPFEEWSSVERLIAPPLVVQISGDRLSVTELAGFLDGAMHLCVVVDPPCTPAPLSRLITPGTLVLQTSATRGLDRFASHEGPAVAALVPTGTAEFIHDPRRGRMPWQRIELWQKPADVPRGRIGAFTSRQQREDVEQLLALATPPALPDGSLGAGSADEVAERLSAWLLTESGLGAQR